MAALVIGCFMLQQPLSACTAGQLQTVAQTQPELGVTHSGPAVDVVLSSQSALAWDWQTGDILYEQASTQQRQIASLSKLLTVLTVRQKLNPQAMVIIPPQVKVAQRQGADIGLIPGQHAKVADLLQATLIASANDAALTLAISAFGSEEAFSQAANALATKVGLTDTTVANATGLSDNRHHSTARDVKTMITLLEKDGLLWPWLGQKKGFLVTAEGNSHTYSSTNQLLDTYLPVVAAKTGYTIEAGENLVVVTRNGQGHKVGAVILGSTNRFQDLKVLVEWIWRNYTWNTL